MDNGIGVKRTGLVTFRTYMQLLDPPTSDSPIPHGILFRYQDEDKFLWSELPRHGGGTPK